MSSKSEKAVDSAKSQQYRFRATIQSPKKTFNVYVDAPDERTARFRLRKQGRVLLLKKKGKSKKLAGRMSYGDRQIFFSRLSAMLASGVGVSEALRLLKVTFRGSISTVAGALLDRVEANGSLPEAMMELNNRIIPKATAAMIEAGSYSGSTANAIKDAMQFENTMVSVKKESSKGIWNALLSFVIALLFILGTVFGFLPYIKASPLMASMGDDQSIMDFTISFSYAVGYVMGLLFFVFIVMFGLATVGRKIMPHIVDRMILKIPYYKDLVLARSNFVAFYGLSLLVKTGVSLEAAFRLLAETTPPGALQSDFKKAESAVRRGQPWANEISSLEDTDRAALGATLDRQQVANAMTAISTQYQELYAQRMGSLVPILQSVSALCLLLSGLIMFGLTTLPMMQLMNSIL